MNERYRIGFDITVLWAVSDRNGAALPLTDKEVHLYYTNARGRHEADIRIQDGNVVVWDFFGKDQRTLGNYTLTLEIIQPYGRRTIKMDKCGAFALVGRSCEEGSFEGEANINNGGEITLASELDIYRIQPVVPVIGENGNWWVEGVDTGKPARVDVVNAADEEDITSKDNLLKLKDRNDALGMGYVILRKNKTFAEQVTKENTIYEIRYDFDLEDSEISLPKDIALKFEGGKLSNGILLAERCQIISASDEIFSNIELIGSFYADMVSSEWFQITEDADNTIAINSILNIISPVISFAKYDFPIKISVRGGERSAAILVKEGNKVIDFASNTLSLIPNALEKYRAVEISCDNVRISNLMQIGDMEAHEGTTGEWGHGLYMAQAHNVVIENCEFSYNWGDGIDLIDTYEGDDCPQNILIENVRCLYNRRQGISIEAVRGLQVRNCEFAYTGKILTTAPSSGLDIEPWQGMEYSRVQDVTIERCYIHDNVGVNLQIQCNTWQDDKTIRNGIALLDNRISDSSKADVSVIKEINGLILRHNVIDSPMPIAFTIYKVTSATIESNLVNNGSIYAQDGDAVIRDNIIKEQSSNTAEVWGAGGLFLLNVSSEIEGNHIESSVNPAVVVQNTTTCNLRSNRIISATAMVIDNGVATIERNILNIPQLHIKKVSRVLHTGNIVHNNGGSDFYAIMDATSRADEAYTLEMVDDVIVGYGWMIGYYRKGAKAYLRNMSSIVSERYGSYGDYWVRDNNILGYESNLYVRLGDKEQKEYDGNAKGIRRVGGRTQRPSTANAGTYYADWDLYMPLFYINGTWRTADGITAPVTTYLAAGTTAQRPSGLGADQAGMRFFDKTISKPIWWNGSGWVDATGASV